ncbi:MAG: GLUG motif-containing protein [Pseudomonadota bacterium]
MAAVSCSNAVQDIEATKLANFAVVGDSTLDFGTIVSGQIQEKAITVENSGGGSGQILSVDSSALQAPFSFKGGAFPGTEGTCSLDQPLAQSASCTMVVTFSPVESGTFNSEIRITYNNGTSSQEILFRFLGSSVSCDATTLPYGGGLGSAEDPFRICVAAQLLNVGLHPDRSFLVTSDLDLAGTPMTPLSSKTAQFTGIFDGGGHVIANVSIDSSYEDSGFFGFLAGATVRNLVLKDITARVGQYGGGLAGRAVAGTKISGVQVNGTVTSPSNYVGGLVGGLMGGSTISASSTDGSVSGYSYVGGLVGQMNASSITGSHSTAAITGRQYIGGLVGLMEAGSSADHSYAEGTVQGRIDVGGFAGSVQSNSWIKSSQARGQVSGTGSSSTDLSVSVGGFVGHAAIATISLCSATGDLATKWTQTVGGFVAETYSANISDSFAKGGIDVSGVAPDLLLSGAGGFVGTLDASWSGAPSTVTRAYAAGQLYMGERTGQIDGRNYIESVTCTDPAAQRCGGFAAYAAAPSQVTLSYWDTTQSDGIGTSVSAAGEGHDQTWFMYPENFDGWNTYGWILAAGTYPQLPALP